MARVYDFPDDDHFDEDGPHLAPVRSISILDPMQLNSRSSLKPVCLVPSQLFQEAAENGSLSYELPPCPGGGAEIVSSRTNHSKQPSPSLVKKEIAEEVENGSKIKCRRKIRSCPVCGFETKYLTLHMRRMHHLDGGLQPLPKKHKCEACGKEFHQSSHLRRHILTHVGQRPYACDICDQTFTQTSSLNRHLAVHSGDKKKHECESCHRRFVQASDLRDHMRVHSGEKQFRCEICGLKLARKYNLREHLKTHLPQEKEYTCVFCQQGYTKLMGLQRHLTRYAGKGSHPELG